jgi:hypothetical protein
MGTAKNVLYGDREEKTFGLLGISYAARLNTRL